MSTASRATQKAQRPPDETHWVAFALDGFGWQVFGTSDWMQIASIQIGGAAKSLKRQIKYPIRLKICLLRQESGRKWALGRLQNARKSLTYKGIGEQLAIMLTNSATADTIIGTSGNDTVTGASGTVVNGDTIIDQSSTDNDTANLVVTGSYTPTTITKIENVNVDWNAFGTATYDFSGVTGANAITLTTSKVGFLGASTITAGASQHIVAGTGMTGAMTITGATTAITVDATNSSSVSVTGTGTATVNAGASTTSVTTSGFTTATVNAGTATAISVTDAAATTNTTSVTTNANSTITNSTTGALTLNVGAGKTVTMNAIGASLNVTGDGDVTINSTGLTNETVTKSKTSGTLTLVSSVTGAEVLTNVQADKIKFTGTVNGAKTVANGANVEVAAATTLIDVTVAGTGSADSATVTFTGATPTATNLTLSGVETLNVVAAATEGTGTDFTVTTLDLDTASNKVVVTGSNDISLGNITGTGQVNASAVTGSVTLTQAASQQALTLTGSATAANTVTFTATTGDASYTGGTGADTVTFANTTGNATAVLSNGANTVTASSLTTGSLVVIGGDGVDTVTATTAGVGTGEVNLNVGAGNNVMTVTASGTNDVVTITAGAGNDSLTLSGASTANDVYTLNMGDGTDTLTTSVDLTAGTWNVTGLETIASL